MGASGSTACGSRQRTVTIWRHYQHNDLSIPTQQADKLEECSIAPSVTNKDGPAKILKQRWSLMTTGFFLDCGASREARFRDKEVRPPGVRHEEDAGEGRGAVRGEGQAPKRKGRFQVRRVLLSE